MSVAVRARYPRTHRIAELLDLIQAAGGELPEHFDGLKQLTPFAVEFRYDVVPAEEESPIDKEEVHRMLRELRAWVEDMVNKRMAPCARRSCGGWSPPYPADSFFRRNQLMQFSSR